MTAPVLSVKNLTMRFGGLVAIDNVSLDVARNSVTALIGPNGAGKTTLFNCLTGFYRPSAGRMDIRTDAQTPTDIAGWPTARIVRKAGIARTFQNIRLFRGMTVYENLLAAQHHALAPGALSWLGALTRSKAQQSRSGGAQDKAQQWLTKLELVAHANRPAGELPYGLQRKAEIARALCTSPQLLCLDEPAAGLNPQETAELSQFLRDLRDNHAISILLIEHDMRLVMNISDHVHVLDHGQLIASGSPAAIRCDPAVIRAYLGEDGDA